MLEECPQQNREKKPKQDRFIYHKHKQHDLSKNHQGGK